MVQAGSLLKVVDKSGVTLVRCIKVLSPIKNRIAYLGEMLIVSVRMVNPRVLKRVKLLKRRRYYKGTIHRALLVRSCVMFKRSSSILIKFNENSVIFVNKKKVPLTNRSYGPILRELCMASPALGCITRFII